MVKVVAGGSRKPGVLRMPLSPGAGDVVGGRWQVAGGRWEVVRRTAAALLRCCRQFGGGVELRDNRISADKPARCDKATMEARAGTRKQEEMGAGDLRLGWRSLRQR